MDLSGYRSETKALLGAAADPALWNEAVIDAGLKAALREFREHGPVTQRSDLLPASGRTLDLSEDGTIHRIVGVACPYEPAQPLATQLVPVRLLGGATVWFETACEPVAGERYLLLYRPAWQIKDLEGATATTVWAQHEGLLVLGGAAWAAEIHCRQAGDALKAKGPPWDRSIMTWANARLREFHAVLESCGELSAPLPAWGDIGLEGLRGT